MGLRYFVSTHFHTMTLANLILMVSMQPMAPKVQGMEKQVFTNTNIFPTKNMLITSGPITSKMENTWV